MLSVRASVHPFHDSRRSCQPRKAQLRARTPLLIYIPHTSDKKVSVIINRSSNTEFTLPGTDANLMVSISDSVIHMVLNKILKE